LECPRILRRCLGAATDTVQVLLVFRVQEQSIHRSHHSMARWRSRQFFCTRRSLGYSSSDPNPGTSSYILANGPCWVKQQSDVASPEYNIYSWNNYSNILYLDQPIGSGFSYSEEKNGSLSGSGKFMPESIPATSNLGSNYPAVNLEEVNLRGVAWPVADYLATDTTEIAAVTAWHTLQAFFSNLHYLDSEIKSKDFNLFTQSYGGICRSLFHRVREH
jgi:hypothetical protein